MANPEHLAIFEKGVDVWNAWQRTNYVRADLNGIDLGMYANTHHWTRPELWNCNFTRTDLREADGLQVDFSGSNFEEADLRDSLLVDSCFHSVNLTKANLTSADLGQASFEAANLAGADLHGADLGTAHFETTNLARANLC